MLITPANLEKFFDGINMAFQNARMETPTFYKEVATEVPSGTARNVYPFLSKIPGLREWVGPRQANNVAARSYELVNKHYEGTIEADRNTLEDDQEGIYTPISGMLGQEVAEHPDRKIAEAIEAGTTALCWDGQFFFDTDHPVDPDNAGAGTQSNKLVGAGYDIAVADPLVPFAAARAAMAGWKREDGENMGNMGNLIMVHPNEEKPGLQIVEALNTMQVAGANTAAAGVSNVFKGKVSLLVNPYLKVTAGRPWYLLNTTRQVKPFLWQTRKAAEMVAMTNINDSNVFYEKKFVWGVDLRAAAGYTFPFLAFRMSAS
jgi:phage major head subunit gpT-like protein